MKTPIRFDALFSIVILSMTGLLYACGSSAPTDINPPLKKVLFVCQGNSGRSQMAEAFFNQMAGGKAQAFSAGTNPASGQSSVVIALMKEKGIDISDKYPKKLTPEMLNEADRVILLGYDVEKSFPGTTVPTEVWPLDDPKDQPIEKIREVRDEIEIRVERLLQEFTG